MKEQEFKNLQLNLASVTNVHRNNIGPMATAPAAPTPTALPVYTLTTIGQI